MADRRVKVVYEVENSGLLKGTKESVKATEELKKSSEGAGKAAQDRAKDIKVVADADQRAAKAAGLLYAANGQLVDSNGKVLSSTQAAAHGVEAFSDAVYLAGYESEQAAAKEVAAAEVSAAATKKRQEAMKKLAPAVTAVGVATLAGSAIAVRASMVFEKAMSSVEAATHAGAIEMGQLRQAAIDAGADTAFSAVEAAQGIEELAKAGVSTSDILNGGLNGALSLAAAGNLGVGESAEIAASAMTQFKLSGDQIPHLADLLAAGAGKAQGSVQDLGAALNQAGLVASSTGLTIEETTGGLAAFASAGLTGSDAGTSFKTMLQRLTPQSDEAQKKFDELGISAYDAQGNFVGLTDFAGQLQTKMADLSPEARNAAMSVMFGSDAVRASNVLYEQGAEGIQKWIDKVNDSGYAAETAALMQNNLAGDLEKLGGAVDTVLIKSGSGANDALRGLVQGLEGFVDLVGKIPEPVLSVGGIVAGLAGGAALLGGTVITTLPKIRDTRDAINDLFPAGSRGAKGLDKVGKAMNGLARGGAVAGGILAVGTGLAKIAEASYLDDIAEGTGRAANGLSDMVNNGAGVDALNRVFQKIDGSNLMDGTDGIGAMDAAIQKLFADDPGNKFDNWGQRTVNAVTGIKGTTQIAEEAFGTLDAELANLLNGGNAEGAADAFAQIQQKLSDSGVSAEEAAYLFPAYSDALQKAEAESKKTAEGSEVLEGAIGGVGDEADDTAASLDDIVESLKLLGVVNRDAEAAADAHQSAIKALDESIAENGKVLKGNSEEAIANRAAMRDVADTAWESAQAYAAQGEAADVVQGRLESGYETLLKNADAMGMGSKEAEAYAREIMGIPADVSIETWMSDTAMQMAEATAGEIEAVPGYKKVAVAVSEDGTVGQVQSRIDSVTGKTEYVFVDDDGTVKNVQTGIANINGKDVPVYVGDDGTVYSTQGEINGIKGKNVTITATAATSGAEEDLNWVARSRTSSVTQTVTQKFVPGSAAPGTNLSKTFLGGGYTGGVVGRLIQGRANGGLVPGQIPLNSQGDNVLAMVNGRPFGLRSGEMVVNEKATRENLPLLQAINDGLTIKLPGWARGGIVGRAQSKVDRLQRQYSRMSGSKANRSRKLDLKDDLDAAKKELAAAKESAKTAEKQAKDAKKKADDARKEERERQGRLAEGRFDLRRDLKRGEITDSFTSGSGMSVVDRLFEQSSNKDLSRGKRTALRSTAYGMESQLLGLEKQSESLKSSLDKATEARDRLLEVSKSVASGLRGEYSLGNVIGNLLDKDYKGTLTAGSFVKSAQGKARQIRKFGQMLAKLRKKGYNEAIIQEIADLGTAEGTQVGNALLGASSSERKQLNNAYEAMDYWSGKAGVEVTKSMERGGVDAAEGLVAGLESKSKTVEDAFYKLGKNAEKAFKRSLDIRSPSKKAAGWSSDTIDGSVIGIHENTHKLETAMAGLGQAGEDAFSMHAAIPVSPTYGVPRYAQAQTISTPQGANADDIRTALAGMTFELSGNAGKLIAGIVDSEVQAATRNKKSIYL